MAANLRLLGGAALEVDGAPVSGPAAHRHRLALLALLAASPHHTLSRDKLVGYLWPNHSEEDARHLLRQAVYMVRKELGEAVLVSTGEQLGLDRKGLATDWRAFEEALERGDPRRAVELYGGPFLDGFHLPGADEFDHWAESERNRLADAYAGALETLAAEAERAGERRGTVAWWRKLAAHSPYDSRIALRLMHALAAAGDTGDAVLHADAHAALLEDELGVSAAPEVTAFAERLKAPVAPGPADAPPASMEPRPPPPVTGESDPSRWRSPLAIGVGVLALLVGGVLLLTTREPAPTPRAEDRAAILPFAVLGDERFAYLGTGIVELLSSKVEGAGPLRSVDPRALLTFVEGREEAESDLALGRAVAERFGAGLFVAGSIVTAGDRFEIHATVYDAEGRALARLPAVTGREAEIFSLVDQVARNVVASRYEEEGERLSRLAATTTSSLPALKAYLEGEASFRAGGFDRAVEDFRRAVEQDSTFALAWYRLAVAAEWALDLATARDAVAQAVRHGDRLAEPDRLLLDAWQAYFTGSAAESERLYRRILDVHPENVEAWFQLGEVVFHYGPLAGRAIAESREAFRQVLALEPGHEGALLHLARIAARQGDVAEVDRLVGRLRGLNPSSELAVEMETLAAFAKRDSVAQSRVVAKLRGLDDAAVFTALWTAWYADPVGGVERLAAILAEPARGPDTRATGRVLLAAAALAQGRWEAAKAELDLAERDDPDRAIPVRALFAAAPYLSPRPAEMAGIRRSVEMWDATADTLGPATTVFLTVHDGLHAHLAAYAWSLLASRSGDSGTALQSVRALEQVGGTPMERALARDLALGARVEIMRATDPGEALAALEQIQGELPYERAVASPFFALSRERWLHAQLLEDLGRHREALPLYGAFLDYSLFDLPYLAPSHLARARIHERLGDREEAVRHYRRFIELWRDADPELRPLVEEARRRLARLSPPSAP